MKKELYELESSVPEEKKGKPEGFFAPSELHGKRLADAMQLIAQLGDVTSVLDVGCGYGDMYHLLAAKFPDLTYVGIDTVEWVAQEAANRLPDSAVVMVADLASFESHQQFDVVLCLGVMAMIDKEVAPAFVTQLYKHTARAMVIEWHDSTQYAGKFTAYTKEEMVGLFMHPFRTGNSAHRAGESSITTLIVV